MNMQFSNGIIININNKFNNQLNEVLLFCVVYSFSTIWYCRNLSRFEDRKITMMQAISMIKRETSIGGYYSKIESKACNVVELMLLRCFKLNLRLTKAPSIIEVNWKKA
ncbi:unnamed protein product [Lupinus luteus]|uniref:Uncharacterized protein n=1 Tax=Lupinus luteus TaxID=3873 RepID=A0AAV1XGL8_LUPLU